MCVIQRAVRQALQVRKVRLIASFCRAAFKYVVAPLAEEIQPIDGDGDDFDPNASCSTISNGRPMFF